MWGMLTGKHWMHFQVGKQMYRTQKVTKLYFGDLLDDQQEFTIYITSVGDRQYWMFQGRFFWDDEDLDCDQVTALLVTKAQRRGAEIERAQQIHAVGSAPRQQGQIRGAIPDDVKHSVWVRDGGACRSCGSNVELQFDHVIPVSMGGGSSPENLQILCGPCNRRKGARVAG
jgi:hypothetical protein